MLKGLNTCGVQPFSITVNMPVNGLSLFYLPTLNCVERQL
jgi:hypothetical protein